MVFKHKYFYLLALQVLCVSCTNLPADSNDGKTDTSVCDSIDSVYIRDLMGFEFRGNVHRKYPNPCLSDSLAFEEASKTGIFSIYKRGEDSLLVLWNKNIFSYELDKNNVFPRLNDSTLKSFYSKHYKIETDPDPPYWTALISEQDSIVISIKKTYESYTPEWIYGSITGTTFKLNSFIRIGLSKQEFFSQLGVSSNFVKSDFTVLLFSVYGVQNTWHEKFLSGNSKTSDNNYIKYILKFRSDKVAEIQIL